MKVENTSKVSTEFDFQQQSEKCFYAAVFFSEFKHHWQPITKGNVVALEFDLVWRPCHAPVLSPISLPDFLTSVKLVNEALSDWSNDNRREVEEEAAFLIIPLEDAYHNPNFHFSALSGNDRKMAHILQSFDFIDLHLAVVSKKCGRGKRSSYVQSIQTYEIVRWVHSNISLPQFQDFDVDLTKHLVGTGDTMTSLLKKSSSERLHPMLIIQPKLQSIRRCCALQFDAMLAHMESRSGGESSLMRMHSTACLEQVLSYCQTDPLNVWGVGITKRSKRTLRLFDICRDLQAQNEGLVLLEILGMDVLNPNCNPLSICDGITDIARSIVGMIMKAGGNI